MNLGFKLRANAHTEQELKWIKDLHRRNPNISICEMYIKLREEKAYSRHPGSLYRVFVRLGFKKRSSRLKRRAGIWVNIIHRKNSVKSGSLM